jgi:hypothetical protein
VTSFGRPSDSTTAGIEFSTATLVPGFTRAFAATDLGLTTLLPNDHDSDEPF